MRLSGYLGELDIFLSDLQRIRGVELDENTDIVLSLDQTAAESDVTDEKANQHFNCSYYLASHENRSIFWFDSFEADSMGMWQEIHGATEPSHVGKLPIVQPEFYVLMQI
jgi:hypothetical protein